MEKVYESEFIEVVVDRANNLAKTIRKPHTQFYTTELYKKDILAWREVIITYHIEKQLVDERKMKFTIEPDLQIWVNQNLIGPAVQAGLKKVAFVVSPDIFAQISVEQLMQENESSPLDIQYFDEEENAHNWLLE